MRDSFDVRRLILYGGQFRVTLCRNFGFFFFTDLKILCSVAASRVHITLIVQDITSTYFCC